MSIIEETVMRLACITTRTLVVAAEIQAFDVNALFLSVIRDVDCQQSAVDVPVDDTFLPILIPSRHQVVDSHGVLTIQVVIDNLVDVVRLVVIFDMDIIDDGTIQIHLDGTAFLFLFVLIFLLGISYQELVVGRAVIWLEDEQVNIVDLDRSQYQLSS